MKYGLIKDGKCIYYGNDDLSTWQGCIDYNENGERLTAAEMIAKYSLKELVLKSGFIGNVSDYNFVEQGGKLIQADLKAEIKAAQEKAAAIKEALANDALLCKGDFKWLKQIAAKNNGNDLPYTEEYMLNFEIERQAYRDRISALEIQYSFKLDDVKAGTK